MSQFMKELKAEFETDTVEHFVDSVAPNPIEPSHYTSMAISPLEYIEANPEAFTWCTANVIKYVSRAKKKNGLEDLKKAAWYLNHEIENMEKSK